MKEQMSLRATNGTIIAYSDRLVISRKGLGALVSQGIKGDKTIFYSDLASIEFKKPGWTNGYIQFIYPGTVSTSAAVGIFGTSSKSMKDENTLILRTFNKKFPQLCEEMYDLLMRKIQEYKVTPLHSKPNGFIADELAKLAKLKEQGSLTEDEFNKKKAELL